MTQRSLRKLTLALILVLLFAFTASVSAGYLYGWLSTSQYIASIYIAVALIAFTAYIYIQWRN